MRLRALLVFLLTFLAALADAQQQQITNARPLEPADPRGQRATALVNLLAAGDFDAAKEYLRAHAAPGAADAAAQVEAVRSLFEGGGLQLANVLEGRNDDVLAVLTGGGGGGRVSVIVDVEREAPHRIRAVRSMASVRSGGNAGGGSMIGTHAKPVESGSKGQVLAAGADHYAVRRAAQLVTALNDRTQSATFIADAWNLAATGETAEEATGGLETIRERTGEGVVLREVELAAGNEVFARLVNRHGRKTTLGLSIDAAAPHRMHLTAIMRELEEVTAAEATPKNVVLATPVVTAPLTFEDGRPFTEVWIEGKGPYRFMVETGFSRINITPRVAAELGELLQSASEDTMYRLGEAKISSMYDVDELRIGGARLLGMRVNVTPKQPGVDGVLGLSAFADLLLTVDYPKQQLRLEQGALPEPNGSDILPTRNVGPFLGVDVAIGDQVIPAVIDTQASRMGGAGLSLTPELAPLVKFEAAPVETGKALVGQRHESIVTTGRLAGDARLGRYTFRRPLVAVMTFGMPHEAGNLGADWLHHFAVTIDQKNGRARFAASGSPLFAPPPPLRTFGLTAKRENDVLTVASVRAGGPAARAGVKEGDVVVSLGGKPAKSLPRSLNSLAVDAKPVTLELLRNGAPRKVTLKSEVLVK